MHPRRLMLAVAFAALAAAAPAHAATVSVNTEHHYLVVEGGRFADTLSVMPGGAPGSLTVAASGGRLTTSGAGCTSVTASTATCTAAVAGVYIGGAAGDDVLRLGVSTPMPSYLVAGDGNDTLRGASGADQLYGQAGDDDLDGGGGVDTVWGQDGADVLRTADGVADRVACGTGADRVLADGVDAPFADCESVQRPAAVPAAPSPAPPGPALAPVTIPAIAPALAPVTIAAKPVAMSGKGVVRLAMRCPSSEPRVCRGRITVRLRGGAQASALGRAPVIGRARFTVRPGSQKQVRVRLSRNGRRRIIRRQRARCSVVARMPVAGGAARTRDQDLIVKAPKGSRA